MADKKENALHAAMLGVVANTNAFLVGRVQARLPDLDDPVKDARIRSVLGEDSAEYLALHIARQCFAANIAAMLPADAYAYASFYSALFARIDAGVQVPVDAEVKAVSSATSAPAPSDAQQAQDAPPRAGPHVRPRPPSPPSSECPPPVLDHIMK